MTNEEQKAILEAAVTAQNSGNYDEAERLASAVVSSTDPTISADFDHHTRALSILGTIDRLRGKYHEALDRYSAALKLSESAGDKAGMARALGNIGTVHTDLSDYAKALEYYISALSMDEKQGNKAGVANWLSGIGTVHWHLSDYTKALEHYVKGLGIDEELGNKAGVAIRLGNIGLVHVNLSDYAKALEYFVKALSIDEELGNKAGVARHLSGIGMVYMNLSDYAKALEYFVKSLSRAEELGNKAGVAATLGNIGIVHWNLSDYAKALEYYNKALCIDEELGKKAGVPLWLGNIGIVHLSLSDYTKALEYHGKALSIDEELGNKAGVARHLGNIGNVHLNLSDYAKALEYNAKALIMDEELGNKAGVANDLSNIGSVHEKLLDYDRALEYYSRGMQLREELGQKSEAAETRGAIGGLYSSAAWHGRDDSKAEAYLLESIAVNEELGTKKYDAHKTLAELYERQERWKEFAHHYKKYHDIEKEVQSEEAKKSAVLMEQRKQAAEREKQLSVERGVANATRELLDAVLPTTIATRMISGEERIADYFPTVSILFADIVGFTAIATEVPPVVVIDFLNYVFNVFDQIIERNGCEKIKTIGDGYMAVAGAPHQCDDHAERVARAALEMQEDIVLPDEIRRYLPKNSQFSIRIGIHTGSAVCGVIGKKRFVWDVYSDAVNVASRMESSGEPGKIHVSKEFSWLLDSRQRMTKSTAAFKLEERGEMEIKGKGMMRTYFLEKA